MKKLCLTVLMIASAGMALAELETDTITISNNLSQTSEVSTNVFMGKLAVGTNDSTTKMTVNGDLLVTGPMNVPKQGDVSMGGYTNGMSVGGISGGGCLWYTNAAGDVYIVKKIGIGTNNPSVNLEVMGDQNITGNLTVNGQFNMGNGSITNLANAVNAKDAVNFGQAQNAVNLTNIISISLSSLGTPNDNINMITHSITNMADAVNPGDAVTLRQAQNAVNLTNLSYCVSAQYYSAANNTNAIAWIGYTTKSCTITNITTELSSGGPVWGDIYVATNGKSPTAYDYMAYTGIVLVANTASNLALNISIDSNCRYTWFPTNGSGTNASVTFWINE